MPKEKDRRHVGPGFSLVLFLNGSADPGWSQAPQRDLEIFKKHTSQCGGPEACGLGEGSSFCRFKEGTDVDKITNAKLYVGLLAPKVFPYILCFLKDLL